MQRLGRILCNLFAIALTVLSFQALAETQLSGRDFNHMSTGFPLLGGHATAACETCHIGGVFKGTPKACDGCHSLGKRIVATPKSSAHIVTDAPCETCHFNTATFLGARYNHANAQPGQCMTCHNGRLSNTKPATHNSGNKASKPCDSCHRSSAWLPASWNHNGVTAPCSTCHISSPEVSPKNLKPASHSATLAKNTFECNSCHSYLAWLPAAFKHINAGGICGTCHDGVTAKGKTAIANHIPTTGNNCDLCHNTTSFAAYTMNHSGIATCKTCHDTTSAYPVLTKRQLGNHQGSAATQDCSNCHSSTTSWGGAGGAMPSNHIPFNAGVSCTNCHIGATAYTAPVPMATLHTNSSLHTCAECHITPNAYTGNNQKTKSSHKGSAGSNCSSCHKSAASYGGWGT